MLHKISEHTIPVRHATDRYCALLDFYCLKPLNQATWISKALYWLSAQVEKRCILICQHIVEALKKKTLLKRNTVHIFFAREASPSTNHMATQESWEKREQVIHTQPANGQPFISMRPVGLMCCGSEACGLGSCWSVAAAQ